MELSEKLSLSISDTPFRCRPLAFILSVYLLSLLFYQADKRIFAVFAAICILWCAKELLWSERPRLKSIMAYLTLGAVLVSVLASLPFQLTCHRLSDISGERTVKAVIKDVYYERVYECSYLVEIKSISGDKVYCKAELILFENAGLAEYDTVTVKADVSYTLDKKQGADRLSAVSCGSVLTCEVSEIKEISGEARKGIGYTVSSVRRSLAKRFEQQLCRRTAEYAQAMLLGDKDGLSSTFRSDMSALGISHILAVSGMHMSIIAFLIIKIVERISYSRKIKSVAVIIGSVAFMAVAGFSPSVVRSAIMLIISMLSVFFYGKSDSVTSLLVAAAIICFMDPQAILNCGFLLSFFATLGIVVCTLYVEQRSRKLLYSSKSGDMRLAFRAVKSALFSIFMTLCAVIFTAPVMAVYFGSTSLSALATNFIASPMAFLSVVLSVAVLVFGSIPLIGAFICSAFDALYLNFERLIKFLSDNLSASVSLRYPFFYVCLALVIAVFAYLWLSRVRSPLVFISTLLAAALVYGSYVQIHSVVVKDRVDVVYCATKTSESLAISSGNESYVIDIGNGGKSVPLMCADEMFNEYYDTRLDGFVITHYHSRHIGIIKNLIKYVGVNRIYLPYPETEKEEKFYKSAMLACAEEGFCGIVHYKRGEALMLGRVKLESLPYNLIERSAHPVLAFRISYGGSAIGYLGASVSESSVMGDADGMLSACSHLLVGAHGPVNKVSGGFVFFDPSMKVYLSPYEKLIEQSSFPGLEFVRIKEEKGMARAVFRLS